jgi:hypothetical protein
MLVCINPLHVALSFAENDPIYFDMIKIHGYLIFILFVIPYHNILHALIGEFSTIHQLLPEIHGRS